MKLDEYHQLTLKIFVLEQSELDLLRPHSWMVVRQYSRAIQHVRYSKALSRAVSDLSIDLLLITRIPMCPNIHYISHLLYLQLINIFQ